MSSVWAAAVLTLAVVLTLAGRASATGPAKDEGARLFAAHALALRAAGVAGDPAAAGVLGVMPGAAQVGADVPLAVLWSPFFHNAMVKLGRVPSPMPAALYYNPLLDVALLTRWERQQGGYRVASARALPGERLADAGAKAALRPQWTSARAGPVQALAAIAEARLGAFEARHPEEESAPGGDQATFATASRDMRAALPWIVWNAVQLGRWAEGKPAWLKPALARIEETLASRAPAAITGAAPGTDPATAEALAGLPERFAEGLALDMVLKAQGGERMLIGSLVEDGDMYVLVVCGQRGSGCALRRFILVSLSG